MKNGAWQRLLCAAGIAVAVGASATLAQAAPSGWLNIDGSTRFIAANGGTYDWANSGVGGPSGTCTGAGAVDAGGSGGLFNCGRPGAAGAPPIAPTLTPAAAADPSIISAVFAVDPIAGDTTACGVGDPTTLNGGKNGDAISSYAFSTGPVPAKDDLSDVYAVSHTRTNGHPEIYFGAERLVNNGDSHMDFEFLQSTVMLSATCSGTFSGHRTEGDLLVAVDFTGGGALAGDSVYFWHCAADPGPQPADGTVCDPSGGPEHYQLIAAPTFTTFTVNSTAVPCGGWVCRDQIAGNSTTISTNDLLEGGVDLGGIPFSGCFNTFLPHTRTAQSFTSVLKDFAGPLDFRSCRTPATSSTSVPSASTVAPGTAATDAVTAGNGGAGLAPTGNMTFFLCAPAQVTGSGCPAGGIQVGAVKALVAGAATSDPTTATTTTGKYCWRTQYTPDAASTGIYAASTHTNATTECFTIDVLASLPNTGAPESPGVPAPPLDLALLATGLVLAMAWKRSRTVAVLLIAGLMLCAGPPIAAQPDSAQQVSAGHGPDRHDFEAQAVPATPLLATERAGSRAWWLVIPQIGVDAAIEGVGLDPSGAMAAPADLDSVGWFKPGPFPGQPGDAVIAGHFGLPRVPAVFRDLQLLRSGDVFHLIAPDGRSTDFRVVESDTVPLDAHPPGIFARTGPARLSLITCAGTWIQSQRTYSERLIVTAVPAA